MESQYMAPRKKRNPASLDIARAIIDNYQPKSLKEMHEALKEVFGPMFEAMLQGEMDDHLGYTSNQRGTKQTDNRRNGYSTKKLNTSMGEVEIETPRDRDGSFSPVIIPKRTKDVSEIEEKVLSMYARGLSQRDIAQTIEEIYGFAISHDTISRITDRVIDTAKEWQNRPLKSLYTFVFVDCIYVNIKRDMETKNCAVYVVLAYDANGQKDVLGLWVGESEGKHYWMQIFDEIKNRGVEDILFICMDGVSGLEEGAKSIFKDVVVQRCIVHLTRNSLKYIPSKDYKAFTSQLKKVYGAINLKTAEAEIEHLQQDWGKYPGAIDVWRRNWTHVEQLFNYSSAVRKVMYTTNAIESVNSSFRKVTKKGSFPNEDAVLKAFYLRLTELYKKWKGRPVSNWAMVRNQLSMDDKIQARILKHESC
jgi:transposase-like protein